MMLLALFAAGLLASLAIGAPPPGKGNNKTTATTATTTSNTGATTTTTSTTGKPGKGNNKGTTTSTTGTTTGTTTTTGKNPGKVLVCHKAAKGKYVLISVSKQSAPAELKRTGDVLAVDGKCPGPITTTSSTTTTTP